MSAAMRIFAAFACAGLLLLSSCSHTEDCCAGGKGCCENAPAQQVVETSFLKPGESRTFSIEYVGKALEIPAGTKKLRVWLPVPQDSTVQSIKNLAFSKEAALASEPKYGNRIAYFEIDNPGASAQISMTFACTRLEIKTDLEALRTDGKDDPDSFALFRKADTLVLVDDTVRKMADNVVKGKTGTVEKARAIYDYVVGRMTYDKNHVGWGRGSTLHACEFGKGNCTDFHALFNSLARAEGIASGFEIGLYLPYDRKSDEKLGAYHCWALFRVPGKTWVPVDCSEAARFEPRREFFFGSHTSNRVTLSTGRDITLVPRQSGEPLNYFLNPYAEADGKPVKTDKSWSFKDLD
jgi:hypothetical protein